MNEALYLRTQAHEVGDYVLLTGDPARVELIMRKLDNARVVAQNREFYTVTGDYKGISISGVSSGIGASSAAIAIEELAQMDARAIVRVGTMMGVRAPMGSFVISSGATRNEGTSKLYLPLEYPAVPDFSLITSLYNTVAQQLPLPLVGLTASYDGFYTHLAPSLVGRGELNIQELSEVNILSLDMETSLLYVLGTRLKIATASMCLVTNNAQPFEIIESEARQQGENQLIQSVLDGLVAWDKRHG